MQANLAKILALLLDKDERVRSAAMGTTHRIVSHRLVIPIDVCVLLVPYPIPYLPFLGTVKDQAPSR